MDAATALPPDREDPHTLVADAALLEKYRFSGPRYTSYPTADRFDTSFGPADALDQLRRRGESAAGAPLSVYVHIPFCDTLCYYCACNKIVTRNRAHATEYLGYLEREIVTQRGAIGREDEVAQLHWGGGTPTFLTIEEISRLMECLRGFFRLLPDGEISIEVDPRRCEPEVIEQLGALGFNRLSIGVQDLDPVVQRKVNRIQPLELTAGALAAARRAAFRSVSFDLIYGLPAQSAQSMEHTLDSVIELRPDRIALYNYAHLPEHFMPQRRIDAAELPAPDEKIRILALAIDRLTSSGYVYIGMDHFALPGDDLAIAQARGALQRNFQGYSTHARCDLLAFGVSAISAIGDSYGQNHRTLEDYYASLDRGELPVMRGHRLVADDRLRREVIQQLACQFRLGFDDLRQRFGIDFHAYFRDERAALEDLQRDGIIALSDDELRVTARGRLLVRVACMAFDRYLRSAQTPARFSKVI
jgi:oxygen-independent coproporphyrinogen III oxidase